MKCGLIIILLKFEIFDIVDDIAKCLHNIFSIPAGTLSF